MLDLYREIARRRAGREIVALATVIKVKGSTPREPGAKMVVTADGRIFGTIGGGCGEAEVQQAALDVIGTRRPRLVHVDLTADTESITGAICGGTMEVFVEPVE